MLPRSPEWLDERSRALHVLIAEKIQSNPELLQTALSRIQYWRDKPGFDVRTLAYLDQWERLIRQGLGCVIEVMCRRDETSNALRQASPFPGILSHQERFEFFRTWGMSS